MGAGSKVWKVGCGVLVLILAGGVVMTKMCGEAVHKAVEEQKKEAQQGAAGNASEFEVTAEQMCLDYAENEVAANGKYKGKIFTVTGTVKNIDAGISDRPYIILGCSGDKIQLSSVHVIPAGSEESKVALLKKGQTVKLKGKGDSEIGGSPFVNGGVFVD